MDRIKKALNVLADGCNNPIIRTDMVRVVQKEITDLRELNSDMDDELKDVVQFLEWLNTEGEVTEYIESEGFGIDAYVEAIKKVRARVVSHPTPL